MKARKAHIFERDELDWYVEPERATRQLLARERFMGPVWDPACGGGNIIRALVDNGHRALGTDIKRRVDKSVGWFHGERDFLKMDRPVAGNIICNPPYYRAKGTEAFVRKAIELAWGKVAIFATLQFLAGAARASGLYQECKPTRVWIITPRVSCPPGQYLAEGGKAQGDTKDYCWLVWDKTAPAPAQPAMDWLTAADGTSSEEAAA